MENDAETAHQWRVALRLLREISALEPDAAGRAGRIQEAHAFFAGSGVERLEKLARLLTPKMTEQQLLCVLVPVERVAARERITDADMGLLSEDSPEAASADAFPLILVADNIRAAVNIGGLFRTAEFFGAQALWLCGYTATPEHPHVARSAMGAEKLIPWRWFENVRDAVSELRDAGFHLYALETAEQAENIASCRFQFPAALILGNERFGIDPEILAMADSVVAISAHGVKNSLNVVSACAIAAHALRMEYNRK